MRFVFGQDNKAMLIEDTDTVSIRYSFDENTEPITLDITVLENGEASDRWIGVGEFNGDAQFRWLAVESQEARSRPQLLGDFRAIEVAIQNPDMFYATLTRRDAN